MCLCYLSLTGFAEPFYRTLVEHTPLFRGLKSPNMKKLNATTKVIVWFSFIGIIILSTLTYSVIREQNFLKSGFRKKVKEIESFKSGGFYSVIIDCVHYTDGTSTYFSTYSVIDENDTLIDVRVVDFIDVGDSLIKFKDVMLIKVLKLRAVQFKEK